MSRGLVFFLIIILCVWPAFADVPSQDFTLLDRLISVPVESTRVVSVNFTVSDGVLEDVLANLKTSVETLAHAKGVKEIAYWGDTVSISNNSVSGYASFLMTTTGADEKLTQALAESGYTATITPYMMGKCGDMRQSKGEDQ